jgi:AcrR family transcriptional regulator
VPTDRRARRRQETLDEILDIAEAVMSEEGVNGLSLAEVARRLGVQPPSLYRYFPSLRAVYDALFRRGAEAHLDALRDAMADAEPGLATLAAGLDASGRWSLEHQPLAQLLFWRPVPNFEPSPDAFAPSVEMVELVRRALTEAVAAGELGPGGDSDEAVALVSIFTAGTFSQAASNEPDRPWGEGRFSPLFPKILGLLPAAFPPRGGRPKSSARARTKS